MNFKIVQCHLSNLGNMICHASDIYPRVDIYVSSRHINMRLSYKLYYYITQNEPLNRSQEGTSKS